MFDLEDWCKKWADEKCKEFGGGRVSWVCFDAKHKDMKQYPTQKLSFSTEDIKYTSLPDSMLEQPGFVYTHEFMNESDVEDCQTFKKSAKTTNTFAWSISEGAKVGGEISTKVKIPFLGGVDAKVSTELSLSSTQGKTESTETTWEVNTMVKIPAHSKVVTTMVVVEQHSTYSWNAEIKVTGCIAFWCKEKYDLNRKGGSDKHWLWFPSIVSVFREKPHKQVRISGSSVYITVGGTLKSELGLRAVVKKTQVPIEPSGVKPALYVASSQIASMESQKEIEGDEIFYPVDVDREPDEHTSEKGV